MGFAYIDIVVHGLRTSRSAKMLVDTGSTYIVLDPGTIEEPGLVEAPHNVGLTLADGEGLRRVEGKRGPTFIAMLDTSTPPLGVYALETLGFKVDSRAAFNSFLIGC